MAENFLEIGTLCCHKFMAKLLPLQSRNTTKLPQSVYTAHVITPDHRVFLMDGDKSSEESHTGEKIHEVLRQVSVILFPHIVD